MTRQEMVEHIMALALVYAEAVADDRSAETGTPDERATAEDALDDAHAALGAAVWEYVK